MAVHIPIRPTNRAVPARCDPGMDACFPEPRARACIDSIIGISKAERQIKTGQWPPLTSFLVMIWAKSPRAVANGSFLRLVVHADQSEALERRTQDRSEEHTSELQSHSDLVC